MRELKAVISALANRFRRRIGVRERQEKASPFILQAFDWLLGELVIFDYDKSSLNPQSKAALSEVTNLMQQGQFKGDVLIRAEVVRYCTGPRDEDQARTRPDPEQPVSNARFFLNGHTHGA